MDKHLLSITLFKAMCQGYRKLSLNMMMLLPLFKEFIGYRKLNYATRFPFKTYLFTQAFY